MSNLNCNACSSKASCPILKSEILQKYLDNELDIDLARDISQLCTSIQSHALNKDEALEHLSNILYKFECENTENIKEVPTLVHEKIARVFSRKLLLKVEQIVLWHNCINRVSL